MLLRPLTGAWPSGRRGYFFIIDAIVAATILLFGLFVLFGSSIRTQERVQPFSTAEDFATVLQNQPLFRTTNAYYINTLLPGNLVPFPDATPLEEVAYLVIANGTTCPTCWEHAYNFSRNLTDDAVPAQYGAAVVVNGSVIYNRTVPKNSIFLARPIILYVRMNETTIAGPITGEVQLWY